MIIRELVASYGIDFDEKGFRQAEQAADSLDRKLAAIGVGLSLAGIYSVFDGWLGAASSVEEELNVVQQTFGDATQGVLDWADATGEAMGRSSHDLAKYAGQLGAVLAPMLGTKQAAAEMSTSLAGLSVDLASFFNKSDEETMERLRSGILGSTEAVDQLGINLRQEHVEAVMAAQGMRKHWEAMTEGEKVQARYLTIMKDTVDKQNDAHDTIGSFSNQLKVAKASVYDMSVVLGQRLLPYATEAIRIFTGFADGTKDVLHDSALLETGLTTLAGAATLLGGSFVFANWKMLAAGGGATLFLLALEDLYTSLEGGDGYIADFFIALKGEDWWKEVVDTWRAGREELGNIMFEIQHPEDAKIRAGGVDPVTSGQTASGRFLSWATDWPTAEEQAAGAPTPKNPWWVDNLAPGWVAGGYNLWFSDQEEKLEAWRKEQREKQNAPRAPLAPRPPMLFSDAPEEGPLQTPNWLGGFSGPRSLAWPEVSGGVPLSIPAGETTNVTNNNNNYSAPGDIHVHVEAGTPDETVRSIKRAAQDLIGDKFRSLKDATSSRG